jgi:hypothetical protein
LLNACINPFLFVLKSDLQGKDIFLLKFVYVLDRVRVILCVHHEIKLREHDIISAIWENILHTIPAIEREQLILEDTMQRLSQYEKRYPILTTDSIGSLLETWQAHLRDKGLHVWNMLNSAQKLFYLYRLKFQCQLADIIDHIA